MLPFMAIYPYWLNYVSSQAPAGRLSGKGYGLLQAFGARPEFFTQALFRIISGNNLHDTNTFNQHKTQQWNHLL